jgi:hypothetical protein
MVARMFSIKTHNGIITVFNSKTGGQRTFKIKTQKKDSKFAAGQRIIYLLVGPNNESDYRGFGFVNNYGISLWSKNRTEQFLKFKVLLENPEKFPYMEFHHEGKCRVCNKTLSTRESIINGIGPVCLGLTQ